MPIVKFTWKYERDEPVYLYGSFNDWSFGVSMYLDSSDSLIAHYVLDQGTYEYKFKIGDRWCYDIMEPTKEDENGNINNFIVIE